MARTSLDTIRPRAEGWLLLCVLVAATASAQEPGVTSAPQGVESQVRKEIENLAPAATAARGAPRVEPATLVYWNRPIATFRSRIGSATPEERVEEALERLGAMSERTLRGEARSRLGVVEGTEVALVTVGDQFAFAFLPADLDPLSDRSFEEVSDLTVKNLARALAARAEQRSLPVLLRGLGEAAAATVVLGLLFWLVRRTRRWWIARVASERSRLARIRIFEIDLGQSVRRLVEHVIALLLWLVAAFLFYTWLTFVLSRFPYTEPWGDALGGWLVGTLAGFGRTIVRAVPDLVTIALILLGARGLVGLASGLLEKVERGDVEVSWMSAEVARGARRIVVLAIWLFTVAIVYPFIPGSSTGSFRSVSVLVGLMLSVASAGLINHVMAGWVIIFSRSLRVGDYVKIGEVEGTVLELGALSTKILNRRHEEVVLPNALVTSATTTNFSRHSASGACIVSTAVTIGYDAPWRQVHAMLLLAAERTEGVRSTPAPRVVQRALSDFYAEYELVIEVDLLDRARILSALHANIQDEFNRHGVQIMSPHFEIQPAGAVVVPAERWFAAPASASDPAARPAGSGGNGRESESRPEAAGHPGSPNEPSQGE